MKNSVILQESWGRFTRAIEECRHAPEAAPRFAADTRNRAIAYRTLAQVQAMAYNFAVAPFVNFPRILVNTTYNTTIYTLGLACQDFYYGAAFLDGRRKYRLHGRLGAVKWAAVQVQSGVMGTASPRNLGDFNLARFADDEGRFNILVGTGGDCGISLAGDSRYNFLWIRRILADWSDDPGELLIEAIDAPDDDETNETAIALRIEIAADFASFLIKNWGIGLYDNFLTLAGGANSPAWLTGPGVSDEDVGSPQAHYGAFVYRIQPGEVLLIEGKLPRAAYWGIQLGDVWSNSLDFVNHQADLNMARLHTDSEGRYQAVVAQTDPGIRNWLDCCGHSEGVGMIRIFGLVGELELPRFKVVPRGALDAEISSTDEIVGETERQETLAYRRLALQKLYGE